jgi:large subunit ribosomal protein L27Ae
VFEQAKAAAASGQAPVVDVTKFGYFKVLGRGKLPKVPVIVKAKFFSKLAERKIKDVGGACLLTA